MAKIKGQFVGELKIEFDFDEGESGLRPFDQIKEILEGSDEMATDITEALKSEFGEPGVTITVTKKDAFVEKVEE